MGKGFLRSVIGYYEWDDFLLFLRDFGKDLKCFLNIFGWYSSVFLN